MPTDTDTSIATENENDDIVAALVEGADDEVTTPEEIVAAEPKKPTLHEAVSEAFDKLKTDKAATTDKNGKRTVKTDAAKATEPVKTDPAVVTPPVEEIDPITGKPLSPIKAPARMPVSLREKWNSMPRAFQEYYSKRELDMENNYTRLGADSKFAEGVRKNAEPLAPMLKQWGMTLEQATERLYAETHLLFSGTPQQKAKLLATLIRDHRPDANVLRAELSGQAQNIPMQVQRPVNIDQEVEKKLQQRQEQEAQTQADKAVNDFMADPANEFANDVRPAMLAAIQGGLIPEDGRPIKDLLKAAYDFVVKNHPEISAIVAARGQTTTPVVAATTQASSAAPAVQGVKPIRSAKPALGSGKATGSATKKFKDSRDAALAAWDELAGND